VLTDTRPEYGYWAMMWIVAKVGFFVWVLRQLLRYAVFHWMTKLAKAIGSYSQPNNVAPVTNHGVGVRESSSNVTIISRREIPRHEAATDLAVRAACTSRARNAEFLDTLSCKLSAQLGAAERRRPASWRTDCKPVKQGAEYCPA
jgi:hypothetical protein